MTTVVLHRVPRDLGWPHLVRAICHHAGVPVSTQAYWTGGHGDIVIDLGRTSAAQARYVVELYTLTLDVGYDVLEDSHNTGGGNTGSGGDLAV